MGLKSRLIQFSVKSVKVTFVFIDVSVTREKPWEFLSRTDSEIT